MISNLFDLEAAGPSPAPFTVLDEDLVAVKSEFPWQTGSLAFAVFEACGLPQSQIERIASNLPGLPRRRSDFRHYSSLASNTDNAPNASLS